MGNKTSNRLIILATYPNVSSTLRCCHELALRRHVKFLTALIIKRNNTDRAVTIIIIYTHPSETSYTNTLSDIERRLGITHGKILNSATTNLQEVRIMKPRWPRGIERERERRGAVNWKRGDRVSGFLSTRHRAGHIGFFAGLDGMHRPFLPRFSARGKEIIPNNLPDSAAPLLSFHRDPVHG